MNRYLYFVLIAVAALLLAAACAPGSVSQDASSAADTPVPPTKPPATPTALSATIPPAEMPATATMPPTPVPPTALPVMATARPASPPETGGAANADVLHVRAVEAADGTWTFHVTVEHPDTGWEDYADGWDVLTPDGTVIKPDPDSAFTRPLLHPHENEQPFTRSQSGIAIPPGMTSVRVRAHDLVDGFGGREVVVDLTIVSGEDFEVERNP